MSREPRFNVTFEQAETYPRHRPVRASDSRGLMPICAYRDDQGRLCGRPYNRGRVFATGRTALRHAPARGTPHPNMTTRRSR